MTGGGEWLRGAGVRLRAPEPEDLEVMFRIENSSDLWEMSNTTGPYSRFHLKQYMEQSQNDLFADRQLRLMITQEDSGQVMGMVDVCTFDPLHNRAEVGIVVDREFRSRGIGSIALGLLEDYCFGYLGIHQLYAYIAVKNTSCRSLFQSHGYEETAFLKDWVHVAGGYADALVVQKIKV